MIFQNIQAKLIKRSNLDEDQVAKISLAIANTNISGAQKIEVLANLLNQCSTN
jgi:hypothetical protein